MNKPLLRRVADYIVKHPDEYDQMCLYGMKSAPRIGCIGAIACYLSDVEITLESGLATPQRVLQLSENQKWNLLGLSRSWPEKFRQQMWQAYTLKERARVAYNRIYHMIETGK